MKAITVGFFVCWSITFTVSGQNTVSEPSNYISDSENAGQIFFLSAIKPLNEITEKDRLKTYDYREGNRLDIRVFLDKPLVKYLQQLDAGLSEKELLDKGNFQFSFYVDQKLIYTENLNTGAGTLQSKTEWTSFRIPLISTTNEDSWGRFLWNRFYLANNGEDALFGGKHILKLVIKPYLKTTSGILEGDIIASGEINFTTPVIELTKEDISVQKITSDSDWIISKSPYNQRIIENLNTKILENRFKKISSIVVIKEGKLLLEEYFNGANRSTLHDTRSVGKSFASTLMGIAINDGFIKNEKQTLQDFYDLKKHSNYSAKKDSISLKNLLTMSSSFEGSDSNPDSPGNEENMYPTDNWVKFALDLPVNNNRKNGKNWDYFTAGVVLVGDILHQKVPYGLEVYADKKLFRPLNIKDYKWQFTPQNVANTAGGLGLSTLDLAKYGQLYQNKGKWKDKQLIPQDWVEKSFTDYFPKDENIRGYGYLFWKEVFEIDGKSYEAFACSGNGGNKVYIFQNLPLVIVITATAYNQPYAHPQVYKIVKDYLLPSVLKP